MKPCPRCDATLGNTAVACACGWKDRKAKLFEEKSAPRVNCCHETCSEPAITKIHTATGWANFCLPHYDRYFIEKAKKRCELLNLNTVAEKRQWVGKKMKELYAKLAATPASREPGEDEDYKHVVG